MGRVQCMDGKQYSIPLLLKGYKELVSRCTDKKNWAEYIYVIDRYFSTRYRLFLCPSSTRKEQYGDRKVQKKFGWNNKRVIDQLRNISQIEQYRHQRDEFPVDLMFVLIAYARQPRNSR